MSTKNKIKAFTIITLIVLMGVAIYFFNIDNIPLADLTMMIFVVLLIYLKRIYYKININEVVKTIKKYILEEKYDDAISYLEHEIKKKPKYTHYSIYKAMIYAYQGKISDFYKQYNMLVYSNKYLDSYLFYNLNCIKSLIDLSYHNLSRHDILILHAYKNKKSKKKTNDFYQKCGECIQRFYENDYENSFLLASEMNTNSNIWFFKFFSIYIMSLCKFNLGDLKSAEEYKKQLLKFPQYDYIRTIIDIIFESGNITDYCKIESSNDNNDFYILNIKKAKRKKFIIIASCIICLSIFILTSIAGTIYINTQKPFDININYKNNNANYGNLAMYNEGKIYFEHLSNIYTLNTKDNSIVSIKKGKIKGTLFCADSNLLYFIGDIYGSFISSSDLEGKSINTVLDKTGDYKECQYYFDNGSLFVVNKKIQMAGIIEYGKNYYSWHSIMGSELHSIDDTSNNAFSLYKDDTHFYINDKHNQHDDMDFISGIFNIKNNYLTPYGTNCSVILTYDKNADKLYIQSRGNVYCFHNNIISKLTDLETINSPLVNVSVFSEDDNSLYIVSRNNFDELCSVNKTSGEVKSIYKAASNEHILYICPQYAITYAQGEIFKKYLNDSIKDQNMRLFNTDENCIELECSGNYLFTKRKDVLHIINLDMMEELSIKDTD